nr:MAG TPA: Minor capsid protein [Caudoviricetes sp.]
MKYPCLVKKSLCKTDITCEFEREGLNQYGEPLETIKFTGKCNYQDKARTVLTTEKKTVQVTGTALFPGDICPELPVISSGTVTIFGMKRRIEQGRKARNPDGSVNYTEVTLT